MNFVSVQTKVKVLISKISKEPGQYLSYGFEICVREDESYDSASDQDLYLKTFSS